MSDLVADILIFILLIAGVGFGGIALMGLLIFPDLHSRLYTALRASLICVGTMLGAAVVYALSLLNSTGGEQYATFLFHALFLAVVLAVGIMAINRQVIGKTKALVYSGPSAENTPDQESMES